MKQATANSIFSPETEIKSWEELPYNPQPVTGNVFSPDYKLAECYKCHRWLGVNLLRKHRGYFYCYFCYFRLWLKAREKAEERAAVFAKKAWRVKYIQQNPDLSLRELARRLNISHEAVRYWRKKSETKDYQP